MRPPTSLPRWLAALALAVAACSSQERRAPGPVEATSSRVDVFLRCSDPGARDVGFTIASLELRSAEGTAHALELERNEVRSSELARRARLGGAITPPAEYRTLVVRLGAAWLLRNGERIPLELDSSAAAKIGRAHV